MKIRCPHWHGIFDHCEKIARAFGLFTRRPEKALQRASRHSRTFRDAARNQIANNMFRCVVAEPESVAAGARLIGTRESGSISGRQRPLFEILVKPPGDDFETPPLR